MPPLGTPPGERIFEVLIHPLAKVLAETSRHGIEETRAAIDKAYMAQAGWAAMTARERSDMLWRWHQLIIDHADDLAESYGGDGQAACEPVRKSLTRLRICSGSPKANRVYGETISPPSTGRRMLAVKQPTGVVGTITPWNFLGRDGRAQDLAGAGGGLRGHPQTCRTDAACCCRRNDCVRGGGRLSRRRRQPIYACKGDAIGRS
ncbi:aldehyde dehydrogenase family protein [Mesorhizobium intechi]|uniref:aldehyde dehydrogenase family protein n=1 Tax=Mesorhizobium intechi TaxID=537601 RepID=UPI003CCC6068